MTKAINLNRVGLNPMDWARCSLSRMATNACPKGDRTTLKANHMEMSKNAKMK